MNKDLAYVTVLSIIGLAVSIAAGIEEEPNLPPSGSLAAEVPDSAASTQPGSSFLPDRAIRARPEDNKAFLTDR